MPLAMTIGGATWLLPQILASDRGFSKLIVWACALTALGAYWLWIDYIKPTADSDEAEKRGQIIRHLEDALALVDEIEDSNTGFLIERALVEARQSSSPSSNRGYALRGLWATT
jgi:hypothetical protein